MIHTLPSPKTTNKKTRVGRGYGTGHGGHTAGRGTKGQKSRSGYSVPRQGFEGGQMPLARRLPKLKGFSRGFDSAKRKNITLKLSELAAAYAEAKQTEVNFVTLRELGFITAKSKPSNVKVVFDQEIDTKLMVKEIAVTKNTQKAIEKAGGSVE